MPGRPLPFSHLCFCPGPGGRNWHLPGVLYRLLDDHMQLPSDHKFILRTGCMMPSSLLVLTCLLPSLFPPISAQDQETATSTCQVPTSDHQATTNNCQATTRQPPLTIRVHLSLLLNCTLPVVQRNISICLSLLPSSFCLPAPRCRMKISFCPAELASRMNGCVFFHSGSVQL